jgi:hypothetical protein
MAAAKNAVAKTDTTSTSLVQTSSFDYGEDAGGGFEKTTSADLSIPFFSVLQSNSPEVEDDSRGLKPGQIFNTVTGEVVDGTPGLPFLACHQEIKFVEWVPREKGGGYVAAYDPEDPVVKAAIAKNGGKRAGKLPLPSGNELIETHYVYGLQLSADGETSEGFGVFSFTSTKIKPKRDWFTSMYMVKGKPPIFAFRTILPTVKQKNEKGTFYNLSPAGLFGNWVKSLLPPTHPLFAEAKAFREMVVSGVAKAATNMEKRDETADGEAPF